MSPPAGVVEVDLDGAHLSCLRFTQILRMLGGLVSLEVDLVAEGVGELQVSTLSLLAQQVAAAEVTRQQRVVTKITTNSRM